MIPSSPQESTGARCAYLTYYDARNLRYWSGSGRRIMEAVERAGVEVQNVFCDPPTTPWERLLRFTHRKMGKGDPTFRRASRLRRIGTGLDHQLQAQPWSFLLSPGTFQCAYLKHPAPLVYWIDGTFRVMHGYYEGLSHLSHRKVRENEAIEAMALSRAAKVVCSSEWVRRSVVDDYHVAESDTIVLPFGANLDTPPTDAEIAARPPREGRATRALLVGVEWARKGCDDAIQAVGILRDKGMDIELHIAGCKPPAGRTVPPFVHLHGFLDKSSQEGRDRIHQLFLASDLFLLPTRAEAFGIVFCEAAAYGLPVVAYRTGGVPSVVESGRTGLLVDPDQGPEGLARAASSLLDSSDILANMSVSARDRFGKVLNWASISDRFRQEVVLPLLAASRVGTIG